ncbi:hypothetical protein FRC03_008238 [Tulasnella sp. 419]|nr:hypothetical protein FRC03_008238 [Tulasnella sp. 419]
MPAVTIIQSLPHFVTPEAHADITSSTPQSLDDIPPVLRLLQKDVTIQFEPEMEEFAQNNKGELYIIDR